MAIAAILNWLSGDQNYDTGVALYQEFGKDKFLKKLLAKGATTYTKGKLRAELASLAKNAPDSEAAVFIKPLSALKLEKVDVTTLPEQLRKEHAEKGVLFREASTLHRLLPEMKSTEDRRHAAGQILDTFDKIDTTWMRTDHFLASGQLPEEAAALEQLDTGIAAMVARRNTLRTYISRDEKKLKNLEDGPEKAKVSKRLAAWQLEKLKLDQKLEHEGTIV